jgi:parallel beta-helix repeat protein
VIRDCSASGNATFGIYIGNYCTVSGCVAYNNGSNGIDGGGISTISHCKAHLNGGHGINSNGSISYCSASGNALDGIRGFGGFSNISNCTSYNNTGNGIKLEGESIALNNTCLGNGFSAAVAAGILASDIHNRIEGNNVSNNDIGIQVTGTANFIIRNSAGGNTTNNYSIAADNRYGVILDLTATGTAAATGDSAAGTLTTTTNPWANFAY